MFFYTVRGVKSRVNIFKSYGDVMYGPVANLDLATLRQIYTKRDQDLSDPSELQS